MYRAEVEAYARLIQEDLLQCTKFQVVLIPWTHKPVPEGARRLVVGIMEAAADMVTILRGIQGIRALSQNELVYRDQLANILEREWIGESFETPF